jgi:hypothetical protein
MTYFSTRCMVRADGQAAYLCIAALEVTSASAAARTEALSRLRDPIRMGGHTRCYGRLCPGSGMPLSLRMRLAAREWL